VVRYLRTRMFWAITNL